MPSVALSLLSSSHKTRDNLYDGAAYITIWEVYKLNYMSMKIMGREKKTFFPAAVTREHNLNCCFQSSDNHYHFGAEK